jgi:predicted phosphodiesterase
VKRNGAVVFASTGKARKGPGSPYRFVVFGDAGVNDDGQKGIAYRTYLEKPDFVAIAGDIVYGAGKMSEYRTNYFPIYNADAASPAVGAPLIRSIPFVSALGNHDAGYVDPAETVHDQWGWFAYWSLPLNGPYTKPGRNTPTLWGADSSLTATVGKEFRQTWPQMANYSFDYGNAHWLVLDANSYMNWTDPVLRNWVARDLAAASGATWKFVMFHEPGFNSSKAHFEEQQMRLAADLFEAGGVDIVFTGHVHNYQRSYPLTFIPNLVGDPKVVASDGELRDPDYYWENKNPALKLPFTIDGQFTFDKAFDGVRRTVPHGIIYIVTGGGGAGLYDPEQTGEKGSWQPFTVKMVSDQFSLSSVDVNGRTLTLRQIAEDGSLIDKFTVTKPGAPLASVAPAPRGVSGGGGR